MKSVSIAFVLTILACVCIYQAPALPLSDSEPQLKEHMESEVAQPASHWIAVSAEMRPEVLFRTKRQSHLSLCRYCCNCCHNKGCGFCCRF